MTTVFGPVPTTSLERTPTPTGLACSRCAQPIEAHSAGISNTDVYHRPCHWHLACWVIAFILRTP